MVILGGMARRTHDVWTSDALFLIAIYIYFGGRRGGNKSSYLIQITLFGHGQGIKCKLSTYMTPQKGGCGHVSQQGGIERGELYPSRGVGYGGGNNACCTVSPPQPP